LGLFLALGIFCFLPGLKYVGTILYLAPNKTQRKAYIE
jgi:hypothetical protein